MPRSHRPCRIRSAGREQPVPGGYPLRLRRVPHSAEDAPHRPSGGWRSANEAPRSIARHALPRVGPSAYPPCVADRALTDWLLDSDPALRWQVERDLLGAPEEVWAATRARVATEGFGARLLALQDPDGQWAGGAFFPGDFDFEGPEAAEGAGQPWTATTWSLNSLREWGRRRVRADGHGRAPRGEQPLGVRRTCRTGAARSTAASTHGRS